MKPEQLFAYIITASACVLVGIVIFIIVWYMPRTAEQRRMPVRWHVVTISVSYMCLIGATLRTANRIQYLWGDVWFYLILTAYITGIVALAIIMRSAFKNFYRNKYSPQNKKQ